MLKKFLRYAKITPIDVLIYEMDRHSVTALDPVEFEVTRSELPDGRTQYLLKDGEKFVHNSFAFPKIRLLSLLGEKGPAIGDCVTSPHYRGRNIYPKVINSVARELLGKGAVKVFIVVNSDNVSSIRGIEKAGFGLLARIRAKRLAVFYFDKKIERLN